ncbi:hypothetical protein OPKNFCMD_1326 [Methylobacterium crusticola]|uniref:Uncharacterized protein n=1 Tax=Methylobacterium crusticola TaxID=1697972 RepID=A0ABQ4QTH2_9HYPH|nr:hypothetical protein [Methylobacterium crusticola]GJD48603.1 hypothetical protein OPKNFCMD_1326 [Methylobacterium crusticola]
MRKFSLIAAAFALATGAFWMTMLTSPPKSQAKIAAGIDTRELTLKLNLDRGATYDPY